MNGILFLTDVYDFLTHAVMEKNTTGQERDVFLLVRSFVDEVHTGHTKECPVLQTIVNVDRVIILIERRELVKKRKEVATLVIYGTLIPEIAR